jgi:hypothetical protein
VVGFEYDESGILVCRRVCKVSRDKKDKKDKVV